MAGHKDTIPIPERFFSNVDPNGPIPDPAKYPGLGPCQVWTGRTNKLGYGTMTVGSRTDKSRRSVLAHRLSWEIGIGTIPSGLCVCHKCDNPPCVRLSHLFLGIHADNMRDMAKKKRCGAYTHPERVPRGERHGSKLHPERCTIGSRNPGAKLTEDDVSFVRAALAVGVRGRALSALFGVSPSVISMINTGNAWKHVLPVPSA